VKIEEYIKSLPNDIISGNEVQLPERSFRKIFEFLNLNENDVFYHIGCGDGEGIKIALQEFHVKKAIGVDNSKEKIQQAKKLAEKNDLDGENFLCQDAVTAKIDDATAILFWFTDIEIIEKIVEKIKPESVVSVSGEVVNRSADTINKDLYTGEVEIKISSFEILSESKDLPMPVFGEQDYPEETRLKYRFLDLRREEMHENIILRSKIISFIRNKMISDGFLEFQTPILTASSPEGARDFLVPSRVHPGKFYALPQAPQQFKQMIMIAGFDKYFQIAPCFRDEDGRADRSPGEHYQLDIEMSFVEQEDIFKTLEPIFFKLFNEFGKGKSVSRAPFKKITYKNSMLKYGTDKPDLRNSIEIFDVTEIMKRKDVKTLKGPKS